MVTLSEIKYFLCVREPSSKVRTWKRGEKMKHEFMAGLYLKIKQFSAKSIIEHVREKTCAEPTTLKVEFWEKKRPSFVAIVLVNTKVAEVSQSYCLHPSISIDLQ